MVLHYLVIIVSKDVQIHTWLTLNFIEVKTVYGQVLKENT